MIGVAQVGIERILHVQRISTVRADDFPVNIIAGAFLLQFAHGAGTHGGARVCGRMRACVRDFARWDFPGGRRLRQRQSQASRRIDLMVFEVL